MGRTLTSLYHNLILNFTHDAHGYEKYPNLVIVSTTVIQVRVNSSVLSILRLEVESAPCMINGDKYLIGYTETTYCKFLSLLLSVFSCMRMESEHCSLGRTLPLSQGKPLGLIYFYFILRRPEHCLWVYTGAPHIAIMKQPTKAQYYYLRGNMQLASGLLYVF